MPVYEYFCPECKIEFELMRSFADAQKAAFCPECNLESQKLVSNFGSKTGSYIQAPEKPFRKGIIK
jgi:putative FmdB family regulatory protein